jgi:hypothetical protein
VKTRKKPKRVTEKFIDKHNAKDHQASEYIAREYPKNKTDAGILRYFEGRKIMAMTNIYP